MDRMKTSALCAFPVCHTTELLNQLDIIIPKPEPYKRKHDTHSKLWIQNAETNHQIQIYAWMCRH